MFPKYASVFDRIEMVELKREHKYMALNRRYGIERNGLEVVMVGMKRRLVARRANVVRNDQRMKRYNHYNSLGCRSEILQRNKLRGKLISNNTKVKDLGVISIVMTSSTKSLNGCKL